MSAHVVFRHGWERKALKQPQARLVVKEVADAVLASVIEEIPVVTGAYQESFESSAKVRRSQAADFTAAAKISIGESRWAIIEYGSKNNPAYAPIRRGVERLGLVFVGR